MGFPPRALAFLWLACLILVPSAFADEVPAALAVSGGTVVAKVRGVGAQIYECKPGTDGKLAWQFREPIAALFLDGKSFGRHFAGPGWESADGSLVTAKAIGNTPGTTAQDIPWLKLKVADRKGAGALEKVTLIQRLDTKGGVVTGVCDKAGDLVAAPYSADYVFFDGGS
jgi:hypothetical protein